MFALKAAKRTPGLLLFLFLALTAGSALAAEDEGFLGVTVQEISPSMAKALQMKDGKGVLINRIIEDSPAEKAGLEDGDVIVEFAGKEIEKSRDLTRNVRRHEPGEEVEVVVLRDGKTKTIEVVLGENENGFAYFFNKGDKEWHAPDGDFEWQEMHEKLKDLHGDKHLQWFGDGDHKVMVLPDDEHMKVWIGEGGDLKNLHFDSDRGFMGVHLGSIEGQMGEFFGVEDGGGALVTGVGEDTPAAEAGLKAGDVIVKVGDESIASPDELHDVMSDTEPGQEIEVAVIRKGDDKSFTVTLAELPEDMAFSRIGILGDGDRRFHVRAPRMLHKFHGDHDGDIDIEVFGDDEPRVEIRRMLTDEDDLDELRDELDQLRKELKEMRKELRK